MDSNIGMDPLVPAGTGVVQGDTKAMPDRGTSTRVDDTYGADVSADATNSMGSITGATKSDGMEFK